MMWAANASWKRKKPHVPGVSSSSHKRRALRNKTGGADEAGGYAVEEYPLRCNQCAGGHTSAGSSPMRAEKGMKENHIQSGEES